MTKYFIVGLGNPGEEYENSRHNVGRIVLEEFRKKNNFPEWEFDKKKNALISVGNIGKEEVMLILPETFMNKSGLSLKSLVTSVKKAHNLVVVYDDLDLPLGKSKMSFNRGSGGHKGLESIFRTIKTKEFARIRVGVSPATPSGKIKKPAGDKKVVDFILGEFKKPEMETLKKISKKASDAILDFVEFGLGKAMGEYNKN